MSSVALTRSLESPFASAAANPRLWRVVAVFIGIAFFITEHDLRISLQEAHALAADEMEELAGGGNAARRAAFVSLALLGGILLAGRADVAFRLRGATGPLVLAYVAWCAASVLWSDDPQMTLRRVMVLLCGFVGALGVSRRLPARELCRLGLAVAAGYSVMGLCAEAALGTLRPWAGEYRFAGSVHPNTQGVYLAMICLAAVCLRRGAGRASLGLSVLFFVALGLLVLTKSRTSLAGTLLALGIVWTLRMPMRTRLAGWLALAWVMSAAALVVMLLGIDIEKELAGAALLGREEQAESLTGRIPLWTELTDYVAQRPWLGYGYESFWEPVHIAMVSDAMEWGIREAHSAYVDAVLSVGLIGAGLLLLVVLTALVRAAARLSATGGAEYAFVIGLLVFGLINAGLESGAVFPMFAPFVAACAVCRLAFWDSPPGPVATQEPAAPSSGGPR